MKTQSAKAKFYVYELYDPLNDKVFYIGKGSGDRINKHESLVRQNKHNNKHLANKIKKMWKLDIDVGKRKIFFTNNEAEAYIFEKKHLKLLKKHFLIQK